MKIQFNQVTWYSKMGAIILFLLVIPVLTFYIGRSYQSVIDINESIPNFSSSFSSNTNNVNARENEKYITDTDIFQALESVNGTLTKNIDSKITADYLTSEGHGNILIGSVAKGDLNNDGYEDAIIEDLWCSASCGSQFIIVLNNAAMLHNPKILIPEDFSRIQAFSIVPKGIETAGASQVAISNVEIKEGLIYIAFEDKNQIVTYVYRLDSTNGASKYVLTKLENKTIRIGKDIPRVNIKDPVEDYVKEYEASGSKIGKTDVYKIHLDINNDGYDDVLLSGLTLDNSYSIFWEIYLNNKNGTYNLFETGDSTNFLVFSPAAVGYDTMPGEKVKSVIAYLHGSAYNGSLAWSHIENGKLIQKYITIEPQGKDVDLYKKYIQDPLWDPSSKIKLETISLPYKPSNR